MGTRSPSIDLHRCQRDASLRKSSKSGKPSISGKPDTHACTRQNLTPIKGQLSTEPPSSPPNHTMWNWQRQLFLQPLILLLSFEYHVSCFSPSPRLYVNLRTPTAWQTISQHRKLHGNKHTNEGQGGYISPCSSIIGSKQRCVSTRLCSTAGATSVRVSLDSGLLLSLGAISLITIVHELGHYLSARFFRVRVDEFSVGMGPKLFSFRAPWGDRFVWRVLPLGGYVQFPVQDDDEEGNTAEQLQQVAPENQSDLLNNRPTYQRAIVLSGGIAANILLSLVLYFGLLVRMGYLQHYSVPTVARLSFRVVKSVLLEGIGVVTILGMSLLRKFPLIGQFIPTPIPAMYGVTTSSTTRSASSSGSSSSLSVGVTGPLGLIQAGAVATRKLGLSGLLGFTAYLSLNVAVMNALPLPMLDGGRLVGLLLEKIFRGKLPGKEIIATISNLLLLWFFFKVFWGDVFRLLG